MKLVNSLIILSLIVCINATKLRKRPQPARQTRPARPYWYPEICLDYPENDGFFPHEDYCDGYWVCLDDGTAVEGFCEEGEIFDAEGLYCAFDAVCWMDLPDETECPLNSNEIKFLPGDTCEDYYICNNGQPMPMRCAQGMHWNMVEENCDLPSRAGCDVSLIFFTNNFNNLNINIGNCCRSSNTSRLFSKRHFSTSYTLPLVCLL